MVEEWRQPGFDKNEKPTQKLAKVRMEKDSQIHTLQDQGADLRAFVIESLSDQYPSHETGRFEILYSVFYINFKRFEIHNK
jgi:hypothetical protein